MSAPAYPRVVARHRRALSPWVAVLEKHVQFRPGEAPQVYHSVTQAAYVAILAVTADGRVPIVRQYRPAAECFTWEFPAGTVDTGETPSVAAAREFAEETGLAAGPLIELGPYLPDTGRLSVESTAFFAACPDRAAAGIPEPGIEVRYVSLSELYTMVRTGEFNHQLHVAVLASALLRGHIPLLGAMGPGISPLTSE